MSGRSWVLTPAATDRPKSLKLVVVAFPVAFRIRGIGLRFAHQCRDNGLVKYWLKNSPGNVDL